MSSTSHSPSMFNLKRARAGTKFGAWPVRVRLSTKLKSANIFVLAGWGQSAKFNPRQIFRLYGILHVVLEGGGWAREGQSLPLPLSENAPFVCLDECYNFKSYSSRISYKEPTLNSTSPWHCASTLPPAGHSLTTTVVYYRIRLCQIYLLFSGHLIIDNSIMVSA